MHSAKSLIALFALINVIATGCTTVQYHYHPDLSKCVRANGKWICDEDPAPASGPVFSRETYTGRRTSPAVVLPPVYYGTPCVAPCRGVERGAGAYLELQLGR